MENGPKTQSSRDKSLNIGGNQDWAIIDDTCDLAVDFPGYRNFQVAIPAGAITVALPRQAEGKGQKFRFCAISDAGGSVVIQDQDDALISGKNYTSGTMNDVGETIVVEGNGLWYEVLVNTIS